MTDRFKFSTFAVCVALLSATIGLQSSFGTGISDFKCIPAVEVFVGHPDVVNDCEYDWFLEVCTERENAVNPCGGYGLSVWQPAYCDPAPYQLCELVVDDMPVTEVLWVCDHTDPECDWCSVFIGTAMGDLQQDVTICDHQLQG